MCRLRNIALESVTDRRQTDRRTDDGQSNPYVLLCFAGDTKTMFTVLQIRHIATHSLCAMHIFWSSKTLQKLNAGPCKVLGLLQFRPIFESAHVLDIMHRTNQYLHVICFQWPPYKVREDPGACYTLRLLQLAHVVLAFQVDLASVKCILSSLL